jgi:sec-independent protein translocase protein TatB
MFDVGFSEVLVCFIVALVVLGPERLPGVARSVGRWTGQAKSYLRNLSAELERETQVSELKKQLLEAQSALRDHGSQIEESINQIKTEVKTEVADVTRPHDVHTP